MKIGDIVFLAIIAACVTIIGFVTVPLVLAIPIPGIRSLAPAFFYGILMAIGLMKVRKIGSLFLIALFNGLVLLMMSWVMFANNLLAGLIAELLVLLIFKSYDVERAVFIGAGLYMPLTIPVSLLITAWAGGAGMQRLITDPFVICGVLLGTGILSFVGAFVGIKIGRELKKAGVLKVQV